jgi:hypothetical protein
MMIAGIVATTPIASGRDNADLVIHVCVAPPPMTIVTMTRQWQRHTRGPMALRLLLQSQEDTTTTTTIAEKIE